MLDWPEKKKKIHHSGGMSNRDIFLFSSSHLTDHPRFDGLEIRRFLGLEPSLKERSVFPEHLFAPFSREVTGQVSATAHTPGAGAN